MIRALTAEQARAVEERAVAEQGVDLAALMRAAGAAVAARDCRARSRGRDRRARRARATTAVTAGSPRTTCTRAGAACACSPSRDPASLVGHRRRGRARRDRRRRAWRAPDGAPAADDLGDAAVRRRRAARHRGVRARCARRSTSGCEAVERERRLRARRRRAHRHRRRHRRSGRRGRSRPTAPSPSPPPSAGWSLYPGAALAGEIVVADIGIDRAVRARRRGAPEIWTAEEYAALLPLPAPDAHKNARGPRARDRGLGRVPGRGGARGARRACARVPGYVTLAVPEALVADRAARICSRCRSSGCRRAAAHAFSSAAAEQGACSWRASYDAVVLGPGAHAGRRRGRPPRAASSPKLTLPLVIDADALNALVDAHELIERRTAPTVLTPHPGRARPAAGRSRGPGAAPIGYPRQRSWRDAQRGRRAQGRGHGHQRRRGAR